jgi:hypothetical protein
VVMKSDVVWDGHYLDSSRGTAMVVPPHAAQQFMRDAPA